MNCYTIRANRFFIICLFCAFSLFTQKLSSQNIIKSSPIDSVINTVDTVVYEKVDKVASFPGGEAEWRRFLETKLNPSVPVYNKAPFGTYTVVIQFVVEKSGLLSNMMPLTSHGYGMEKEVMRIMKKTPRWNPAILNEKLVRSLKKQSITFVSR